MQSYLESGLARKYQLCISLIYHDSIMIFSNENIMIFLILSILYYYYLLTFLIHAHLTQTAQVTMLLDGAKIFTKILTLWVGRNNVEDNRHRRTARTIRRT